MMAGDPLICLASASVQRLHLLQQLGVECLVRPMDVDESQLDGEFTPDYVCRLALTKARAGFETGFATESGPGESGGLPVLGADTALYCNGQILTKPSDPAHAAAMLRMMSGSTHQVYTGAAIVTGSGSQSVVVESRVTMASLSSADIRRYVATGEPMGKAGAYAIQGLGARFVKQLTGSYTNVVGLPLFEVAELLAVAGIDVLNGVEPEA